jgi:hypothetical protein
VTGVTHPLFGRLLSASGFKHLKGVLHLVVTLPDGSSGTIAADATDVHGELVCDAHATIMSIEGFRHLRALVTALRESRDQTKPRK